ncbi:MAG: hypothetical protein L0G94_04000 [Brachybacterium sp.]|uniref:hypothetical protein n=1 Tax=Brachybacterium sp. TaxID=1891286 RepID=UPI002648AB5F|nr:hypothetical protein [Brachybacterium sp.]MDN5685832.1 hypothetical protein [Brachybacterium sp.]
MISAEGDGQWVDPLVPVSEGIGDSRDLLVQVAGTASNVALIATVFGVVVGAVMLGAGTVLHRPEWGVRGVATLIGAVACAILTVGLSTWIGWFGGQAIEMWH